MIEPTAIAASSAAANLPTTTPPGSDMKDSQL